MSGIFQECKSLISIPDISKWDISNVKRIDNMFNECESLKSLPDISKWNTGNITTMEGIFMKTQFFIKCKYDFFITLII